jgi:hypothetical protein
MPKKRKPEFGYDTDVEQTEVAVASEDNPISDIIKGGELANIRARSIRSQVDTAHMIAELEALRADIDATLAVLRSQRK